MAQVCHNLHSQNHSVSSNGAALDEELLSIPYCNSRESIAESDQEQNEEEENGEKCLSLVSENVEFQEWYRRISATLCHFLRKCFPALQWEEVKDLVQDTWLRMLEYSKDWESEKHLLRFLVVVAKHLAIDYLRKQRNAQNERHNCFVAEEDVECQIEIRLYLEELRSIVQHRFGPEGWLLLWLCATGWTLSEISEGKVLPNGIASPAVYQHLQKSVSQLSRTRREILDYIRQSCPPPQIFSEMGGSVVDGTYE